MKKIIHQEKIFTTRFDMHEKNNSSRKDFHYKIWWSNFIFTLVTVNLSEQEETYQEIHPCAASNKDREPQKDLQFKRKQLRQWPCSAWLELNLTKYNYITKLFFKKQINRAPSISKLS